MNLKTIKGFERSEEAEAFAKQIAARAEGAQLFAAPAPATARPGVNAPSL